MKAVVQPKTERLSGLRLGILLSASPGSPSFAHGVKLAQAALTRGVRVYLYCIDDAVSGLGTGPMQDLRMGGVQVYGCAYAAERRGLPWQADMVYGGLALLSDLMAGTDRFLAFG
jgi:sulfur relay (sulfurtransferase) complex TusBCD TusD component (DsrE family)